MVDPLVTDWSPATPAPNQLAQLSNHLSEDKREEEEGRSNNSDETQCWLTTHHELISLTNIG